MAPRGRPKKIDSLTSLWIVEQYYHGDGSTQSWGKVIKTCNTESEARNKMELEARLYYADIEAPEIDRSIDRMITIRPNKGANFTPFMEFWYYRVTLIDEEE